MKYTLQDLQKSLVVLEHFGLLAQTKTKPGQKRDAVIAQLNGTQTPRGKNMDKKDVGRIKKLGRAGHTHKEIAEMVGRHPSSVGRVLRGEV